MAAPDDPRAVVSWLWTPEHTEQRVAEWMRASGFTSVVLTSRGADGGVDVTSTEAVAQVKAEMRPVGRPAVQMLYGIAIRESKQALFFAAAGFSREAQAWASQHVALYTFDRAGTIFAVNSAARRVSTASSGSATAIAFTGNAGALEGGRSRGRCYSVAQGVDLDGERRLEHPGPCYFTTLHSDVVFTLTSDGPDVRHRVSIPSPSPQSVTLPETITTGSTYATIDDGVVYQVVTETGELRGVGPRSQRRQVVRPCRRTVLVWWATHFGGRRHRRNPSR